MEQILLENSIEEIGFQHSHQDAGRQLVIEVYRLTWAGQGFNKSMEDRRREVPVLTCRAVNRWDRDLSGSTLKSEGTLC